MAAADSWGSLLLALALPMALGAGASCLMEALLRPRPAAPWRRPWAANATHAGIWLMACAAEFLLFGRPWFAMLNVLAIEAIIVLVSLAKYDALREPFVFQDFEYFTDAIRHPRLYLPFFPWIYAVAAAVGYGVVLWLGLTLESVVIRASEWRGLALILLLACLGWGLATLAGSQLAATFDADDDLRNMGLLAALWAYARAEKIKSGNVMMRGAMHGSTHGPTHGTMSGTRSAPIPCPFDQPPPTLPASRLPDLVSIQSESFFDARRTYPIVKQEILQNFDRLRAQAVVYGELDVAARGANTVRTEFAFLSGLAPTELGVHRFNPYRKLARRGVPTLASYLKKLGYRTVCVHPYYGSFYHRDTVLPELGFDELIDLRAFGENQKDGANIGDRALGGYVCGLLQRDDPRPLYIHVITMENHGPLHLESINDEDTKRVLNGPLPTACEDLVVYAKHLCNADEMFASVAQTLARNGRPAGLCVFGDHVPIMAKVYRALGEPSGTTDALIWVTGIETEAEESGERRLSVTSLATTFLDSVGLPLSQ